MATKRIRKGNRVRKKTRKWVVARRTDPLLTIKGVPKEIYFTYELGPYLPRCLALGVRYKRISCHDTLEEAQEVCMALELL